MLFESERLAIHLGNDQIAELRFDAPGTVNTLNSATLQDLDAALDCLDQAPGVQGLLLTSGKPHFILGADIHEFLDLFALPDAELHAWLARIHTTFNRLEARPYPTLALLRGHVLGGGCECVLTSDFRLADPSVNIGLPETRLGIMPGFGGTVRLPRLIGTDNALETIIRGRSYSAAEAQRLGLLDGVVAPDRLLDAGYRLLREAWQGRLDWQARRRSRQQPLRLPAQEAELCFATAQAMTLRETRGHYPAPLQAIQTIKAAASMGPEAALRQERDDFVPLTRTPQAEAMVGTFLNDQQVKTLAKQAAGTAPQVRQLAVLGAGIMGGGIACQAASRGLAVRLKDIAPEALQLGMQEAGRLLAHELERGRLDATTLATILGRIRPGLDYSGFDEPDLVIEAVVERPDIKRQVLQEVEAQLSDTAILVSNTSTLPISQLATGLRRPAQFCGMHFFNPVQRMPLVEVIRGAQTSQATLSRVMAAALALGKVPILIHDGPGFFVNRVLFAYFAGFNLLLADGVDPYLIDRIMTQQFGWPMGPAQLLDVVGLDTAHHAAQVMAEGIPERMAASAPQAISLLWQAGRLGQKRGLGFYRHATDAHGHHSTQPDPQLADCLPALRHPAAPTPDEIQARLLIPLLNEVVRCLEEAIIGSPAEADMALLLGLGFPAFRGGPCRQLDQQGLAAFIAQADGYQALGPLYHVSDGLRERARRGDRYYPGRRV